MIVQSAQRAEGAIVCATQESWFYNWARIAWSETYKDKFVIISIIVCDLMTLGVM